MDRGGFYERAQISSSSSRRIQRPTWGLEIAGQVSPSFRGTKRARGSSGTQMRQLDSNYSVN